MACPALYEFIVTDHARFEMARREVSEEEVDRKSVV